MCEVNLNMMKIRYCGDLLMNMFSFGIYFDDSLVVFMFDLLNLFNLNNIDIIFSYGIVLVV